MLWRSGHSGRFLKTPGQLTNAAAWFDLLAQQLVLRWPGSVAPLSLAGLVKDRVRAGVRGTGEEYALWGNLARIFFKIKKAPEGASKGCVFPVGEYPWEHGCSTAAPLHHR